MFDALQLDDHHPIQHVSVRCHRVDWDNDQFDVMTAQRALGWDRRLSRGCWFLNPRYTVHASAPSAPFFKKVREVQGSWLRSVRRAIHNRGLRGESRQQDHLGRQLAFSGVLFFDGDIIPPDTWNRLADRLLKPFDFQIVETYRHLDLAALKATANFDPLKQLAQSALQAHVDDHPADAAFVLPHLTLTALAVSPTFYQRVKYAQKQWHRLLKRTLGKAVFRDDPKVSDPETKALVFDGVYYADGQLYSPEGRPDHPQERSIPEHSPCLSPTNLSSFSPTNLSSLLSFRPIHLVLAPAQLTLPSTGTPKFSPTDHLTINEEFKALFGMNSP